MTLDENTPSTGRRTYSAAPTTSRLLAVGGAAVALILVAVLVAISIGGPHHRHRGTTKVPTIGTVTQPPRPKPAAHRCPLTGQLAGTGVVPRRPALGVKIGNDPASRPQSGLLAADIVYEEMAEGGITRYLAVFQCKEAGMLGPVRSVRWDDWHVLASFGHPILAFSGGIDQWNAVVAHTHWLFDANGSFYPAANAYYRTTNRVPPWNFYTSTAALWALDKANRTPPPPQFRYSLQPSPSATIDSSVTLVDFATGESVVWRWDGATRAWERYYGTEPDLDASGLQLHATNVLIQVVRTRPGPYAESGTTPDTESITEGRGPAFLLRNGKLERGTWTTPRYGDTMRLRLLDGKPMTLEPGTTWVEMVPRNYAVQFSR